MVEIYSEKLDCKITVSEDNVSEIEFVDDENSTLVGWTHGGWNNSGGGGSW